MEQEKIAALIEENMKTIFAYSLSRVSHKEDAEDLCGDIILAILTSAPRIRDDDAFFGYIWAIAANTYKKFLRKRNRAVFTELDEETPSDDDFSEQLLKTEEIQLLRRELSLLSREYRECTVAYYIDSLSCSEIATKLGISLEMVKYYLFKTRKLLKEGIGMNRETNSHREFGEKSYKPANFEFITIFSGQFNREYRNLFNRKLPGNILLSAYYTPMTIRELSIELGVSSAYMEDEIALLEEYKLLTTLPGGKYQTNLVIFTSAYTSEFYSSAKEFCIPRMEKTLKEIKEILPKLRGIGFRGNTLDDNSLMWPLLWLVMHRGNNNFKNTVSENQPDEIYDGATGINYGIDYDSTGFDTLNIDEYGSCAFAGYSGIDDRYAASFADFGVLPKSCQYAYHADFVKNALYSDKNEYAVFSDSELTQVIEVLKPQINEMAALYTDLVHCAVELMKVHAPKNIGGIIEKVITKTIFFRTVGLIGKCAFDSGEINIPKDDKPIAVFVCKTANQDKATVN